MAIELPTLYQSFIHKSRYARWREEDNRRETWEETVDRYMRLWEEKIPSAEMHSDLREAILNLEVMPSMRCLMTAGPALARDNVAGFNCSYVAIDHPRAFDEILYILMCGTGVGFSVERQFVTKLPEVADVIHKSDTTISVADSRIGWAKSFKELLTLLYSGQEPRWDLSRLRPAGAKLKTFGGRSSGPEPLENLFRFAVSLFNRAAGRKLTSIECHDLVCKVADIVVVGGVRRSALISLSNVSDGRMRGAKSGQWWLESGHRALANNSAVYTDRPQFETFLDEWRSLYESKSGERGIFSRTASKLQAARNGRRDSEREFGTNPCSEIILRSCQFCNLSEVVVRPNDSLETLREKVRLATIIGTLQSTLTDFRYLRKIWRDNTEEERLLGVSLTGIMDHEVLSGSIDYGCSKYESQVLENWLRELKEVAIETNKEWAERLGIQQSVAITCVKPSGTVSQLVDSASGIHSRFSDSYIRRVRADVKDPLAQFMMEKGFPWEPDVTKPDAVAVFSFPQQSPTPVEERSALEQIKLWDTYQKDWCEHKPSVTITYKTEEFLELGGWVYNNIEKVSGVSFLPAVDHIYEQAPYEAIDESKYSEMCEVMPTEISWEDLALFETEDMTKGTQELACSAGVCEVVDL